MPDVMEIDGKSYPSADAWNEEAFLRSLRPRNTIGMVAEMRVGASLHEFGVDKVAGFMIYELHKSKLELLRVAVHPELRRQSVGTNMMAKLMSKLSSHRRTRICVDVSENYLEAHLFFKSLEWRAVSVNRRAGEQGEDTYRFVHRCPAAATDEAEEVEVFDEAE